jgi:hypothetical protein
MSSVESSVIPARAPRVPDYSKGPVLYLGGYTRDAALKDAPDTHVRGYFCFSTSKDAEDDESVEFCHLQLFFALYPDGSVGFTKINLSADVLPHEFADVDITNLYGPWCLLRKNKLWSQNLILESSWMYPDEIKGDAEPRTNKNIYTESPRAVEIFDKLVAVLAQNESVV